MRSVRCERLQTDYRLQFLEVLIKALILVSIAIKTVNLMYAYFVTVLFVVINFLQ